MKVSITTTTHSLAVYICMVCGKPVNESDTVDHIMSCEQPASFRGERFVPLEGERMNTTAKKSEKKEEEKPKNLMKNLNSFVKNAGSELAKLAKSMEEEDENPEFVCMICGKKLSSEKMQSHTKHCKVPKGFKGSQFMVLESDEMRMKKAEEEEEKVIVKVEEKTEKPEKPEEEKKEEEEPKEEKPVEEVKVTTPNPFDNASEEEESGNPFGAPEEEKKEEKPVEQEKPEEKPVEQEKPEEKPVEEVKVATPNPFDNASEEEENGNPFGAPEEEKKEEKPAEEEKVEEKPEEEKEETAANPFDKAEESEEKPASEEEESEGEKKEGKMRFGFNSLVKNASKSLAKLAKSMEEEDENPEFVCMICGKKLSSEKMQSHTKHCKVPKGFKGSQFMVLESDEMRMKKAEEEEKPVEEEKVEEEKPAEPEPKSANPFDNASEEEEEESGNPFGAPEEEKKEEKPVESEPVKSANPFDNASEEEEESGNPFGAPEEEKPAEPEPKSANPFDNASEEEEENDPVPLEQVPTTPAFISSSKKQKSIFNIFRRDTNERKSVGPNLFSSITQSITSTVTNIVNSTQEPEEDPLEKAAREEEERMRREAAERMRREEEERIRKEREEAERKRREEEERIRKKAMMEQKLNAGIACKKYCGRGKPHPTTVSLITHASKGEMVGVWRGREG